MVHHESMIAKKFIELLEKRSRWSKILNTIFLEKNGSIP